MGKTDGEVAALEVSVPGCKDEAIDMIGDSDAVDLSVLGTRSTHLSALTGVMFRGVEGQFTR